MKRKRILWQLYPSLLAVTLLSLLAVTLYLSGQVRRFYLRHVREDLSARAVLVEGELLRLFLAGDDKAVDALAKKLGAAASPTRITVIRPSGQVIADSDEDPAVMDNHANRPEVIEAIRQGSGSYVRDSDTLKIRMMYFAVLIEKNGAPQLIVRTAMPVSALDETLGELQTRMDLSAAVIALLAAGVCLNLSRRISQPLEDIKHSVREIAQGRFDAHLPLSGTEEIASLSDTLREMASRLEARLRTLDQQRNELEAVLSSMVEGVLAIDAGGRIISVNQAVARLFNLDRDALEGKPLQEVIRHAELQRFIAATLDSASTVEEDIVIYREGRELYIQLHGTTLRDAQGNAIGTLVVLNDVTRLRRLERVRRDFVANVSHEIKTPLTAIKGFVETLLDGSLHEPAETERFLHIIADRAEQLEAVVEDILSLSKIEQDEKVGIQLEDSPIARIIAAVVQVCELKAAEKDIHIETKADPQLTAHVNALLMEQAIANLVDNAVKYSDTDSRIEIEAEEKDALVYIRVRDWGCGIEQEHLGRVFERFYRVDKARSRKLGGTGLGLAIVKHIVQTHGGTVSVESIPGEGSTFTIAIPRKKGPVRGRTTLTEN